MRRATLLLVALALAGCGSHHDANTVSGSRGDTHAAELDVESGAPSITVATADLGGDLYRASTPKGSGVVPKVTSSDGHVRVSTASHGDGPADLTIRIAEGVTWQVNVGGGASDLDAELGSGSVSGVAVSAGDAHVRIGLPAPKGTLTVRLAGGASDLVVRLDGSEPVRVELDGGAAHASIRGTVHTGIAGGTVFTAPGWSTARNRYDLVLTAGVSSLTVL